MTDEPDADDDGTDDGDLLASLEPTEDSSSIQTVRGKRNALLQRRSESILFWRRMLADPIGRRELWEFFNQQCHIFEDRFACGPNGFPQAQATWFHAGEKAVGDRLYRTLLRNDLDGIRAMHREYDANFAEPKPPRKSRSA